MPCSNSQTLHYHWGEAKLNCPPIAGRAAACYCERSIDRLTGKQGELFLCRISSFVVASLFTFFFTSMTAYGQTSVTGTAAAPSLKLFPLGAVVPIGNVDSTLTPGTPATLLSALTGGTMELRRQLNYNAAAHTRKVTGIGKAPGSPLLTPTDATGVTTSWTCPVIVDRGDLTAKPGNALVFLGSAASSSSGAPFRDISSALAIVSAGYLAPPPAPRPPQLLWELLPASPARRHCSPSKAQGQWC